MQGCLPREANPLGRGHLGRERHVGIGGFNVGTTASPRTVTVDTGFTLDLAFTNGP